MNKVEAAKHLCVSKHAVYLAVRNNRLNAIKINGRWSFTLQDLEDYKNIKYKRDLSYRGADEYTVEEAAKYLNCTEVHLYYACRTYKIPFIDNSPILIKVKDLDEYKKVMKICKQKTKVQYNSISSIECKY
jgi:hypothetical protein